MRWRSCLSRWRCWAWLLLCGVLAVAAARQLTQPLWGDSMIAMSIGGTYEYMRDHSNAPLVIWGHVGRRIWGGASKADARLRFVDPQYGFETPPARFFTFTFEGHLVGDIRMSPQVEPLLIDDALKVVLDLQAQWCAKGWRPLGTPLHPTIADTPEWRAYLRPGIRTGTTYWRAGDQYEVMLFIGRFADSRHPDQERYLITLELSKPWRFGDMEHVDEVPHPFPPPQPQKGAIPCQSQPS